ncbi:hypothetical protein BCR44DRAFT_1050017 [Catenaria anguillulae PL171]|uniref:Uncharacterized protein n=1 Tax=Catenaria anguillulae PL171 TaxID=765915 RepID=A0A1Y2HQX4_9FUNG|nr:hypothetical protein BCR44DRAFT_1050017 [Catenaria anguillulae PL171]
MRTTSFISLHVHPPFSAPVALDRNAIFAIANPKSRLLSMSSIPSTKSRSNPQNSLTNTGHPFALTEIGNATLVTTPCCVSQSSMSNMRSAQVMWSSTSSMVANRMSPTRPLMHAVMTVSETLKTWATTEMHVADQSSAQSTQERWKWSGEGWLTNQPGQGFRIVSRLSSTKVSNATKG